MCWRWSPPVLVAQLSTLEFDRGAVAGRLHARALGVVPTVPLDTASPELVHLIEDLVESGNGRCPDSADMRGRLAMAYEVNDFYTEAAETYAQAEMLAPDDFRWPYFRAVLVAESGDFEGRVAGDWTLRLTLGRREYVPAWLYRGTWLNALGRYARGARCIRAVHMPWARRIERRSGHRKGASSAKGTVRRGAWTLLKPLVEQHQASSSLSVCWAVPTRPCGRFGRCADRHGAGQGDPLTNDLARSAAAPEMAATRRR